MVVWEDLVYGWRVEVVLFMLTRRYPRRVVVEAFDNHDFMMIVDISLPAITTFPRWQLSSNVALAEHLARYLEPGQRQRTTKQWLEGRHESTGT